MKKSWFFLVLGLIWGIAGLAESQADSAQQTDFKQENITIRAIDGPRRFRVEIADTDEKRAQGFMHRKKILPKHGMLFLVPHDEDVKMWMKNTPLPLDMLFIDRYGSIIYIVHAAVPESTEVISAHRPSHAVLELPGGAAEANGIHVGDQVVAKYFTP